MISMHNLKFGEDSLGQLGKDIIVGERHGVSVVPPRTSLDNKSNIHLFVRIQQQNVRISEDTEKDGQFRDGGRLLPQKRDTVFNTRRASAWV